MTWFEALPPLIIVCAGVAGIGTLQGIAHRAYYGKVCLEDRDFRRCILTQSHTGQKSSA